MKPPIQIRFACGHGTGVSSEAQDKPYCPECGETRIARVLAPPPKIRGLGTSPLKVTHG